ncbi:SspB family protein [Parvularcula maris]|uniref:ClpXP protease specificity-enhancing factor SspB n=1 Tax=Parvularcula maris TaxID=2965077 RepID=A0A9X2L7S6_9PROT|nr:ClpXP protease specificity-enhancing factor SspB [Parvularcula maris]MCQ8184688.1 ClpXP protease specificity-enhancing factor SspB [Parvularcula maris]
MTDGTELDYAWLTQNAMRGVVREVLGITRELGALPGEHHFYIEFDTNMPGVGIADSLKSQYPDRMTIVLQHQFEGLEVEEEHFQVVLKFKGVPEMLTIPFAAVTQFADPSASFVLQFQPIDTLEGGNDVDEAPAEDEPNPPEDNPPSGGADVVSLDRFRKK